MASEGVGMHAQGPGVVAGPLLDQKRRRSLVWHIAALQAADVFLTWWLLTTTNAAIEGNGVASFLIRHGFDKLVVAKLAAVAVCAWLAYDVAKPRPGEDDRMVKRRRVASFLGLWLAFGFMVIVVAWDSVGVGIVWWMLHGGAA